MGVQGRGRYWTFLDPTAVDFAKCLIFLARPTGIEPSFRRERPRIGRSSGIGRSRSSDQGQEHGAPGDHAGDADRLEQTPMKNHEPGPPMDLGNMRRQGVHHLIAYCLNDACRPSGHRCVIVSRRYARSLVPVQSPLQ